MKSALLVIDVQRSLLDEGPWKREELLNNVQRLITLAESADAPVVFVRDSRVEPDGSLDASLIRKSADLEVTKNYCDAFLETSLHELLQSIGVERVIVCGMQTDYCIDTSCRRAASLGYSTELVREAHTTFDHEHLTAKQIIAHHNRILQSFSAGAGAVKTVALDQVHFG